MAKSPLLSPKAPTQRMDHGALGTARGAQEDPALGLAITGLGATGEVLTAMAHGDLALGAPGATGPRTPTGEALPGRRGGAALRARIQTGRDGLLGLGALLPLGPRGLVAVPAPPPLQPTRRL